MSRIPNTARNGTIYMKKKLLGRENCAGTAGTHLRQFDEWAPHHDAEAQTLRDERLHAHHVVQVPLYHQRLEALESEEKSYVQSSMKNSNQNIVLNS